MDEDKNFNATFEARMTLGLLTSLIVEQTWEELEKKHARKTRS